MPVRLVVLIVLAVVAVAVALILQRRRPDPPSAPSYRAPAQLDRDDFERPDAPALILVFASTSCNTCPVVWDEIEPLSSRGTAVQRIDVESQGDLHKRYKIDGVPTTLIANRDGVVAKAFFGPLADGELQETLVELGIDEH